MQMQQYEEQEEAPYEYLEETNRLNTLNLQWTLGFNYESIDSVHNLTKAGERNEIFYVVGHTGVIYDYQAQTQRLLQGHCNKIHCVDYNKYADIIVTADVGKDSMLIVWDVATGTPKRTIYEPHTPDGTEALAISPKGQYIATLSKVPGGDLKQQVIHLWEWEKEKPSKAVSDLNFKNHKGESPEMPNAYQQYIRFNPESENEIVTTGKDCLIFWSWENSEKGFEYYIPNKLGSGHMTQTVFIPGGNQAVTGTTDGFLIVWDISLIMEDYSQPEERRQIKRVNLMNSAKKSEGSSKKESASINILKIEDQHLVIGSSTGSIRFYDFQYRIIAWFEDIDIGSITNISFAHNNMLDNLSFKQDEEHEDVSEQKFRCPEFIVVDKDAKVTQLDYTKFEQIHKEDKKGKVLIKSIVSPIVDISVRPNSDTLAICCQNGSLYQWDFMKKSQILKELKCFQEFPKCIDYSPNYEYEENNEKHVVSFLAVATGRNEHKDKKHKEKEKVNLQNQPSGKIHIFNLKTNQWQNASLDVTSSDLNKPIVLQQVFSSNSKYLACMDSDYGVTLFCYDYRTWDTNQDREWQYVGKHRVHHAKLTSIAFGEVGDEKQKQYKLFSIAEDMRMCEYNIVEILDKEYEHPTENTNFVKRLELRTVFQIEQESIPTACCWYPINMNKENSLLTVNDNYKIKLWSFEDEKKEKEKEKDKEKIKNKNFNIICKKTVLGPAYEGPITKLLVLNQNDVQNEYQDKYLAYSTSGKIVGIIKLPLEGNPHQTMGRIAHAQDITGLSATQDGKLLFTSGSDDYAINIWNVNFDALEEAFKSTNPVEDPYPALLEGGSGGQTHQDLKDFFYYSQIRSKDENSTKARKLDGQVPLHAIEDMMRSMGYYPTVQEIENMQNEVRRLKVGENGEFLDELDLKIFLRLFVNHRPVYGISRQQITDSLQELCKADNEYTMTAKEFREILQTEGEPLTNEEWNQCVKTLMGEENDLPGMVTEQNLREDVLGFENLEEDEDEEGDEEYDEEEDEELDEN